MTRDSSEHSFTKAFHGEALHQMFVEKTTVFFQRGSGEFFGDIASIKKFLPPEIIAKLEGMNERNRRAEELIEGVIKYPGYPYSGREIVADLTGQVASELGVNLTLRRLAKMWDVPLGTLYHWQGTYRHRQIVSLVLLLERLNDEDRQGFLQKYCRAFPRLRHGIITIAPEVKPANQSLILKRSQ